MSDEQNQAAASEQHDESCEAAVEEKEGQLNSPVKQGLTVDEQRRLRCLVAFAAIAVLILIGNAIRQKYLREAYKQQWEAEIKNGKGTWHEYEPVGWYEITKRGGYPDVFIHTYRLTGNDRIHYMRVRAYDDFIDDTNISEEEALAILKKKGIKLPDTE